MKYASIHFVSSSLSDSCTYSPFLYGCVWMCASYTTIWVKNVSNMCCMDWLIAHYSLYCSGEKFVEQWADWATLIVRYTSPECNLLTILAEHKTMNYEQETERERMIVLLLHRPCIWTHSIWNDSKYVCVCVYIEQANNPIRIEYNRQLAKTVETRHFSHYCILSQQNYKLFMHAYPVSFPLYCFNCRKANAEFSNQIHKLRGSDSLLVHNCIE